MGYQLRLNIADIVFQITCPLRNPISWLRQNYKPFLSTGKADIEVSLKFQKKEEGKRPSFISSKGSRTNEFFYAKTPYFLAAISVTEHKASILADYDSGLVNIMRSLCSLMLIRRGGFLLHASSVLERGFSYVFFGPSQSGKTTVARLSQEKIILTDETTAIVKNNGSYSAYATPFGGEFGPAEKNAHGPIKALFFLHKDACFKQHRLKKAEAVKELFRHIMIDQDESAVYNRLFNTLAALAKDIPCYELRFKPEPAIWNYICGFINHN